MELTTMEIYQIRLEEATGNYAIACKDRNAYVMISWLKIIKDCDKVLANVGEW